MYVFKVSGYSWSTKDPCLERELWKAMERISAAKQWKRQVGLAWSDTHFWTLSLTIPLLTGWIAGVVWDWGHYPLLSNPLIIGPRLATMLLWWPFSLMVGWLVLAVIASLVASLTATGVMAAWRVVIRILLVYGRSRELIVAHPQR